MDAADGDVAIWVSEMAAFVGEELIFSGDQDTSSVDRVTSCTWCVAYDGGYSRKLWMDDRLTTHVVGERPRPPWLSPTLFLRMSFVDLPHSHLRTQYIIIS